MYICFVLCMCIYSNFVALSDYRYIVHCKRVVFRSLYPANAEIYVFDHPTESITPVWVK